MKTLLVVLFTIIAAATLTAEAEPVLVKEESLPDYKSCAVWRRFAETELTADPSYGKLTSTIYHCGDDISVIEFKREGNEKPVRVDWVKTVKRDIGGRSSKEIWRIYSLKGEGVYSFIEYELDWGDEDKK
ncbi:MAG: hypothetical protein HYW90_05235 [Candidatus Sungbacteria bacterium]|nr:hypothetical protein [Candidatus Sungbacteria bacterium]